LTPFGYPPKHQLVREMAEEIRNKCIIGVNTDGMELMSYSPLGRDWTRQFLQRYPDLETFILKTIEAA